MRTDTDARIVRHATVARTDGVLPRRLESRTVFVEAEVNVESDLAALGRFLPQTIAVLLR
jgi:hypothetical protein